MGHCIPCNKQWYTTFPSVVWSRIYQIALSWYNPTRWCGSYTSVGRPWNWNDSCVSRQLINFNIWCNFVITGKKTNLVLQSKPRSRLDNQAWFILQQTLCEKDKHNYDKSAVRCMLGYMLPQWARFECAKHNHESVGRVTLWYWYYPAVIMMFVFSMNLKYSLFLYQLDKNLKTVIWCTILYVFFQFGLHQFEEKKKFWGGQRIKKKRFKSS